MFTWTLSLFNKKPFVVVELVEFDANKKELHLK